MDSDLQVAIRQAVARGWCRPGCTDIEMDANLAEAITEEVMALRSAIAAPVAADGGLDELRSLLQKAVDDLNRGTTPSAVAAEDARGNSLHPATQDLVRRFSAALSEKLAAAQQKYGYSDGWMRSDWMDECRQHLRAHVEKGDPRDVAAYCAFLWHHGESTATQMSRDGGKNIQFVAAGNAIAATDAALTSAYAEGRSDERAEWAAVLEALKAIVYMCERHGDFSNGVTDPTGTMDEGRIRASEVINQARDAIEAIATPHPAPAVAERPSDDRLWDQTLRERDSNREWADKLADAIAKHLGIDIGEHTSNNYPWLLALDAIRDAAPAVAAEAGQGEREAFEAWWLGRNRGDEAHLAKLQWLLTIGKSGDYREAETSLAWLVWQARAALATQPAPPSQGQRKPLSDNELMHGFDNACIFDDDPLADAFYKGAKFAEREHGIPTASDEILAAPTQPPAEGGAE